MEDGLTGQTGPTATTDHTNKPEEEAVLIHDPHVADVNVTDHQPKPEMFQVSQLMCLLKGFD